MGSESMEIIEVKSYKEVPENFTGIVKYPNGAQYWYLKGKLHREDGPAIIGSNGIQYWYLNDVRMTPMEIFEKLSDKQKENALWNLNQWK